MKYKIINTASGLITMGIAASIVAAALALRPDIDNEQHKCMALNIYHEARGEVTEGQIAVAQVTVNRVQDKRWPNTICDVVYQNKQFSWTHMIKNPNPTDDKAWRKAQVIARDVMLGNVEDPSFGANHYHANWVNPLWAKEMKLVRVIGSHLFYE
jgi:N-acetylmuramoyl-L-alanine amidase